ncbi:YhcN/YlaJ family sporulation lipoprotein [Cytobacillus spongiae]|uniref:YhcN/YlaJ family sporulation lipoprotein n=1 Tax=Cytobacillus spongiae TaxID=2901381 RepID=UPI001F20EC89|nr:YhcN/YlaJ family sporulation lipoprotein [Cytobacillus spongiae]UII55419.1 YhcN/YlaJ family sporulation lipoprotein [Cytobacillus spongiae]
MKKTMMIIGICGLTALTACQNDMAREDIYPESGNTINVNTEREELYQQNKDARRISEDFGYTRHQRSPIMGENVSANHYASLNRERVADIIGKYCTEVPNVDDVSTLVTSEEVLIVYETDSENRFETADQVKKMAMSVVPRWYHVYVTDNTNLRKNVENYASVDSDSTNVEYGLNKLIKQMVSSSPQGRKMSNGENANGEAQGEMNDDRDKDDLGEETKDRNMQ